MSRKEEARAALHSRIIANRFVAVAMVLGFALAAFFWFYRQEPARHQLRMTAGEGLSHRHRLAEILRQEAAGYGLDIDLVATAGSQESLAKVSAGEIDVALTLGDFDIPDEHIRQIAVLDDEAMHLFVRPELVAGGLIGLRGKTLSLGNRGSNTHKMAERLMSYVGLQPDVDYQIKEFWNKELLELTPEQMPDGVFAITSLPWGEVGEHLVKNLGYTLMELAVGDAIALRNPEAHDMVIPAYSYGMAPAVPDRPLHTIGQKMLVVASRGTSELAIERLMRVLFESEFGRRARLPNLDSTAVLTSREFPLHDGARKYLNRNEPLIKADSIDKLENLRSFLVSAALAIFLFWRWQKRRNMIGFETYIDAVSEVELEALAMDRENRVDQAQLRKLGRRLSELKNDALERQSEGVIAGEEQMASFLTHVSDVRNYIQAVARQPQDTTPAAPTAEPDSAAKA